MRHKSATQPLCRHCGGKIGKDTNWVRLSTDKDTERFGRLIVDALPKTKTECSKHTNHQVMTVRRDKRWDDRMLKLVDHGIDQFSTWDGETYVDKHFCNGDCAKRFAYAMAGNGYRIVRNKEYPNGVIARG